MIGLKFSKSSSIRVSSLPQPPAYVLHEIQRFEAERQISAEFLLILFPDEVKYLLHPIL